MASDGAPRVPSWNGDPDLWESYKEKVKIWLIATKPEPHCSLAARLIQNLSGTAQRIGLKIDERDLLPEEERWEDRRLVKPANHKPAVEKLLQALSKLAPNTEERRGTYLEEFFTEQKYRRRTGEKLTEWIIRWEEGSDRLKRDGIDFMTVNNLPGWFFLKHANIGEQRAEMVRTHLAVEKLYDVDQLKLAFVRLFPNIHHHEKRLASRFRPKRSNQIREVALEESDPEDSLAAEEYEGEEDYAEEEYGEDDPEYLQEVFAATLQGLSEELADDQDFDDLCEEEQAHLENAARVLAESQEALETVKSFRQRKGKGGPKGGAGRGVRKPVGGSGRGSQQRRFADTGLRDPPTAPPYQRGKQKAVRVDRRVAPRGSLVDVQVLPIRPPPSVTYAVSMAIGVET